MALESRLDNIVYRLGFAPSRKAARQLVRHRHVLVNGRVIDVPSYSVKPGPRFRFEPVPVNCPWSRSRLKTARRGIRCPGWGWTTKEWPGAFSSVQRVPTSRSP